MEEQYQATAKFEDGKELNASGNIIECAAWSDNVIRANQGAVDINIVKVETKGGKSA